MAGTFYYKPSVVSWGSYRLDVVVSGQTGVFFPPHSNHVWHRSWNNGSDSGWVDIIGNLNSSFGVWPASAPTVVSWGYQELDVYVLATDGNVYWTKSTNGSTFAAWTSMGHGSQTLTGNPGASTWGGLFSASNGQGRRDVFFLNTAGSVSHLLYSDIGGVTQTWDTWSAPSGVTLVGDPTTASLGDGRISVGVPTTTGELVQYVQDWTTTPPTGAIVANNFAPKYNSYATVTTPVYWP